MKLATNNTREQVVKFLKNYTYIIIFFVIFIAYLIINYGALSVSGVMNILRHSSVVGIIAFGMGIVIITGGIDLSVGSMLALIGGLTVTVFNATNSIGLTFLAAIGIGLCLGLLNGLLIGELQMPAFIVTLATMLIYRSLAQYKLTTTGLSIYNMDGTLSSYNNIYGFGQYKILGVIPLVGIIFILITVVMVFIMTATKFGKNIYAVGGNEKAAKLAGVNVKRVRISVYTITGILCGVSTFIWLAMNGSVDPATLGKSNEMYAIAAVVIGGISMSGGKGKVLGILFGALSYTIIDKIIASLGFDALINDTIKGGILLVAILIQMMMPMLKTRKHFNSNYTNNSYLNIDEH